MASAIQSLRLHKPTIPHKEHTSRGKAAHFTFRRAAQGALARICDRHTEHHVGIAGNITMSSHAEVNSQTSLFSSMSKRTSRSMFFVASTLAATVLFAGVVSAISASDGDQTGPKNVLGQELDICSTDPMTGYFRQGRCETGPSDYGTHTVCAKVTKEFLEYTKQQGNDLVTPRPEYNFPGLTPGNGWCLCASRWREAMQAGVAPPVVLGATHEKTLQYVDMASLQRHDASQGGSSEF